MILATDLAHGFEYVSRFTASTTTKDGRHASIVPDMAREGSGGGSGPGGSNGERGTGKDPFHAQILLMQMVIKVRFAAMRE